MTGKDMLTTLTFERYVEEIMKIPLAEKGGRKYNGEKPNTWGRAAALTRELSGYRRIYLKEQRLRLSIDELKLSIAQGRRSGEAPAVLGLKKRKLEELTLELGKTAAERTKLEEKRDSIENAFVREVVSFRYFDDPDRHIPSWPATVSEMGIAVSGEELRRYISDVLSAG